VLVEALVADAAIDAIHEVILHRFARCDVVPFGIMFLLPARLVFEVELRSVLGPLLGKRLIRISLLFPRFNWSAARVFGPSRKI
jgi:hypothetical protein